MDLNFSSPLLSDKQWVQKILEKEGKISSESAFGTLYIWQDLYKTKICRKNNILLKKSFEKQYEFPRGAKNESELLEALRLLFEDSQKENCAQFKLTELLASEAEKIDKIAPEKFLFVPKRDKFEYIYKSSDLALLSGKKYHGKRNHIAKFSKLYNWKYEKMQFSKKDLYSDFFEKWFKLQEPQKSKSGQSEHTAIKKALENFEELGLSGAVISVQNEIVACTIGEKINSGAFLIHFEKALPKFSEAYSVINQEFAKTIYENHIFINREEDMGIAGLRKSKLSYKPCALLAKYDAVLKEHEKI